jgi:Cysteine-rich CPXCG
MPLEQFENFPCPYCGENNELLVDVSGGPNQEFVVDCEVCCAPVLVRLKIRGETVVSLDAEKENE